MLDWGSFDRINIIFYQYQKDSIKTGTKREPNETHQTNQTNCRRGECSLAKQLGRTLVTHSEQSRLCLFSITPSSRNAPPNKKLVVCGMIQEADIRIYNIYTHSMKRQTLGLYTPFVYSMCCCVSMWHKCGDLGQLDAIWCKLWVNAGTHQEAKYIPANKTCQKPSFTLPVFEPITPFHA